MGIHHSQKFQLIPITFAQLQPNEGKFVYLDEESLKELDGYIENFSGALARGRNFSLSCDDIQARYFKGDIELVCQAEKPGGQEVYASLKLSDL